MVSCATLEKLGAEYELGRRYHSVYSFQALRARGRRTASSMATSLEKALDPSVSSDPPALQLLGRVDAGDTIWRNHMNFQKLKCGGED